MAFRAVLAALCGAALIFLASCGGGGGGTTPAPSAPPAPAGVAAETGNTQVVLSWPAVSGAISYNVYTSQSAPVTTAGTKTNVSIPSASLSALANGTPVFAAVTAVNAIGESALSTAVCAVPTAAPTTGLTLYDALCGSTLDGTKWQSPLLSRGVANNAMELSTQISNMESRTIQFLNYQTLLNVNTGSRVTTLKADITVPSATASRTGNAEVRAIVRLSYQPPADRLNFPGSRRNQLTLEIGLADTGGGLRAFRSARHCPNATCTSRSATGIAFADPAGFTPRASGYEAETVAAYDTTYTVSASLNESSGVFTWSFAGGAFGLVSGTVDPSLYLSGNADWTGSPLAGAGFLAAQLGTRAFDNTVPAGSDGSIGARFQNVQVGLDNGAATLWDDFSGMGTNSGPTELRGLRWFTVGGAPGRASTALSAGSLAAHAQSTSNSTNGISTFDALTFNNPAAVNSLQADVTVTACSNTFPGAGASNQVMLHGNFYNDGTPGTTGPNANQPNSSVGEVRALLILDCVTDTARFQIVRFDTAFTVTVLSNAANSSVPKGSAVTGNTHTLTLKWDPVTKFFTFQVDGGAAVVVDPTQTGPLMTTAAPYAKAANSPEKRLVWGVSVPADAAATGATASIDLKVNNVFTAP